MAESVSGSRLGVITESTSGDGLGVTAGNVSFGTENGVGVSVPAGEGIVYSAEPTKNLPTHWYDLQRAKKHKPLQMAFPRHLQGFLHS